MDETPVDRAERVAQLANELGIETVLIGAYALAAHKFVRASVDIDLAACVPLHQLRKLEDAANQAGLKTHLEAPDDGDPLGGVLQIWVREDDDGDPLEPVEVVNFQNPYRARVTPAWNAIKHAVRIEGRALRYPRLGDLVALKLYSGASDDLIDIEKVLAENLDADLDEVRTICASYGYHQIDELIEKARARAMAGGR